MKTFKSFLSSINESPEEPRGKDERRFKKMHIDATDVTDYPISGQDHVFKGSTKKNPGRIGDISEPDTDHYDTQYVDNGDEGEVSRGEEEDDEEDEDEDEEDEERVVKTKKMRTDMVGEETLIEAVKPGVVVLNDGSKRNIIESEAKVLNVLFTQLNSSNRLKMEERLTSSNKEFQKVLEFAKTSIR
jgi:hypothetical protein